MNGVAELRLRHPRGETPILIGQGALAAAAERLGAWAEGRTVFVVSTERVLALHGAALAGLAGVARRIEVRAVPEGEPAKSLAQAGELWSSLLAAGGKRDSRLVAFGGGSVGDLGGFVAGAFLRGIEVAQWPTTLLAQVDAAIGGKTGIDLPAAKNSVGLFHHPACVVAESSWLETLPQEEIRSGLAEVVKAGVVLDAELFARVEAGLEALLAGEPAVLGPVAARSAAAKVRVVEEDPEECGARALLNFGHTLGHALETAAAYEGLRHGEAVAYGMAFAARLARRQGFPADDAARLLRLLARFALPPLPAAGAAELLAAMARDKKARESGLAWVLPEVLGRGRVVLDVPPSEVEAELTAFLAAPGVGRPAPHAAL